MTLTVDAFCRSSRHFDIDDSSVDEDTVVGLDAVIGCRVSVNIDTLVEDDIVCRMDGVVVMAVDRQGASPVEQQFPLAVESSLVLVTLFTLGVSQRVRGAVGQIDKTAFLAQYVQGCAVGTGDVYTVELYLTLLAACNRYRAIGVGTAQHIAYFIVAMITHDSTVVIGDLYTIDSSIADVGHIDCHFRFEIL